MFMERTKIITISGESGSGKSTFSKFLAEKTGAKVVSVDEIISVLYKNACFCKKLLLAFGNQICENGKVNKQSVGNSVFENKYNQDKLTKISTPYIEREIKNQMKGHGISIIDYKFAPMLSFFKNADMNILLIAKDDNRRLKLLLKRDNLPKEYLLARDKNRVDYSLYHFDFEIIHNYDNLEAKAEEIALKLK